MDKNPFVVLAEKVGWQAIQVFLASLVTADALNASAAEAAIIAAISAGLTVLANGLPESVAPGSFLVDLGYRVLRSYASAFIAYLLAAPMLSLDYSVLVAASAAALPTAIAFLKGEVAKYVGDKNTAALLPASAPTAELKGDARVIRKGGAA